MSTLLPMLADVRRIKTTTSRCPACLAPIVAEVFERGGSVWMGKRCAEHGAFEVLVARDPRFYYTSIGARRGGDADCGSECGCHHERDATAATDPMSRDSFDVLSTCVALIEIVDSCNLACPTCYASSPHDERSVDALPFDAFTERVEGVLERKGSIDVLQLTGGEPALHPEFFRLLDWALSQERIGYVLINTNAVRIAGDDRFRERLADSRRRLGKFELYVQFDGVQEAGQVELRGVDLRDMRRRAIDDIGALGVPTTLAMVVSPQTLPHVGDALRFGLDRPHCRGITFQPIFRSGRVHEIESSLPIAASAPVPISVGDVIGSVIQQCPELLTFDDFTPLPCGDPNCHAIGYLLRTDDGSVGMSRLIDLSTVQGFLRDRFDYRLDDLARCGCESEPLGSILRDLEIGPERPFRIFIKPFMDGWTFDQDRIDRCCTHVIRPDGRLDSFCRYYLHGGAAGMERAS